MKIISARITAMPRPMPEGIGDKMPAVIGTFDGGESKELFSYFPDEISFSADEFVGLTFDVALALYHKRDVEFLRAQV